MLDRSSRPHRSPNKTPEHGEAPDRAAAVASPARAGPDRRPSSGCRPRTVHAVLVRCRINRLSYIDRVTGEPIRRYEHDHPGVADPRRRHEVRQHPRRRRAPVRRPPAGQARTGQRPRTAPERAPATREPRMGIAYVHTVIDDHSRVAYAEICADETADTAIGVLRRAVAWFADRGVTVERVLSDNGSAYRSNAWAEACADLGITHQEDPALPTPDQRQDRTLPPHPGRRLGLRPLLRQRDRPPRRPARLAPHLQSPPAPHRHRRQTTDQPTDQPAWTSQLGLAITSS